MVQNKDVWNGKELIWSGDGKTFLRGVGESYLSHPFFEEAYKKILSDYKPKINYSLCLFLPCSYGKPYSQSFIHYMIIKSLMNLKDRYSKVHQIILTNAGIVPRELEDYYPFCCYDWNPKFENHYIKDIYVEILFKRLKGFILKFKNFYKKFACYLRWNSDTHRSVEMVENNLSIEIPNFSLKYMPKSELKDIYNIYHEEDFVLITPKNLCNLVQKIEENIF